jgi:hypothetical protein
MPYLDEVGELLGADVELVAAVLGDLRQRFAVHFGRVVGVVHEVKQRQVLVKQPARIRQGVVDLPQDVQLQGVVLGEGRRDERLLTQEGLGGYPVERKAGG